MGFFDKIGSVAEQLGGAGVAAKVGGGLMQELENTPGGVSGVFQSFQQNGLGGLVQDWGKGQTQAASPDQIQQGLGDTGMIESVAQRTGMSPDVVKSGLAMLIPLVVHHCVSNGHVTPDGTPTDAAPPDSGNMLQSILGKIL
jgi:uncharacterized protein YidB (DUF937 family)